MSKEAKQQTHAEQMEKLRHELEKLPSRKERIARLRQLGHMDDFGTLVPWIPVSWLDPTQNSTISDADLWATDKNFGNRMGDRRESLAKEREEFFKHPPAEALGELLTVAEARGDMAEAERLRQAIAEHFERRLFVDGEELVFRRQDSGKWRVVADGRAYLTDDPENFATGLAKRRQSEADQNTDGLTKADLLRVERLAASGSTAAALATYAGLALADSGFDVSDDRALASTVHDPKYGAMYDRAAYHVFVYATPAFKPSQQFSNFLEQHASGRRFTVPLIQEAWRLYAMGGELDAAKDQSEQPQAQDVRKVTVAEIQKGDATLIESLIEQADSLTDQQIAALHARARALAAGERKH